MKAIDNLIDRSYTYLNSAQLLYEAGDYESSVSRTYYAMFFAVEAILLTKNKKTSTHKGILLVFGDEFIRTGQLPKEMSVEFKNAFLKRQLGDYKPERIITEEEAEEVLEKGNEFVEKIVAFLKKNKYLK